MTEYAFARPAAVDADGLTASTEQTGMTIKDWFAGQIAAGDAANNLEQWDNDATDADLLQRVRIYYRIASAMMIARQE